MAPILLQLGCVLTVLLSAIVSSATVDERGPAFTNIISNYFTTDPFFKAKQKARLHLPPKGRMPSGPLNAKQDRMSSPRVSPAPAPAPIRMKLGPPINILPSLSPPQTRRRLQTNQKKEKPERSALVVPVVDRRQRDDEVVVPAPLLAGVERNNPIGNNYDHNDDLRNNGDTSNRRQSFSQLISTSHEDNQQKTRFKNFPSKGEKQQQQGQSGPQFKLTPDMPFSFSGNNRGDQPPTVTFKNAEDLRYQNDYYELPEADDFQLQNEIFQDFEAPKIKPGRSEFDYFPKPQKKIKYSEPLNYLNPLDKYHNEMDVEIFEVPSSPFTVDDVSYSNYKSNAHFVDIGGAGPSVNQYEEERKPARSQAPALTRTERHGGEPKQRYFNNKMEKEFSDIPENFFDIPKIPAENFDEHVFSLADVPENKHYEVEQEIPGTAVRGAGQTYKRERNDFNTYNDIDYQSDYQPDYQSDYQPDYPDYEYKAPPAEYETPEYRQPEYAVPEPLPPPPGILEMQHDSVFAGNFDVPKLGVAMEYKPPELVYNEMFEKKDNSFSNLLPRTGQEKVSRSLQYSVVTPSPFLPTPSKPRKPLADYSHLYRTNRRREEPQVPPYVPPTPAYDTKRNFFKPRQSPSLTFEEESEFSNLIVDEDRDLYAKLHGGSQGGENFLHAVAQHEADYEDHFSSISREDFPVRAERLVAPQSSSYQDHQLTADVGGGPRYKRYGAVDYTPLEPQDYHHKFRQPIEPYKPEPFIPEPAPTPAYPTPPPYHHPHHHYPPPTPEPEYFQHQVPEFPAPDNFLHSEPEVRTPDYYSSDYLGGSDYNYNSPSYKTYELDTYEPDYHHNFAHLDIPKLGPGAGEAVGNYNQFVNVAGPEAFEHGHVRGNPEHKKQEYSRREGRHFKSQVTWTDADEGYGKHYFEFNH